MFVELVCACVCVCVCVWYSVTVISGSLYDCRHRDGRRAKGRLQHPLERLLPGFRFGDTHMHHTHTHTHTRTHTYGDPNFGPTVGKLWKLKVSAPELQVEQQMKRFGILPEAGPWPKTVHKVWARNMFGQL